MLAHRRTRIGQELHSRCCCEGLRAMGVYQYVNWSLAVAGYRNGLPPWGAKLADAGAPYRIRAFRARESRAVYMSFERCIFMFIGTHGEPRNE